MAKCNAGKYRSSQPLPRIQPTKKPKPRSHLGMTGRQAAVAGWVNNIIYIKSKAEEEEEQRQAGWKASCPLTASTAPLARTKTHTLKCHNIMSSNESLIHPQRRRRTEKLRERGGKGGFLCHILSFLADDHRRARHGCSSSVLLIVCSDKRAKDQITWARVHV